MSLPGTRADALQIVYTGAVSHAAAQTDPALSLGGFRSSTRCDGRSFFLRNALANVTVDHVGFGNDTGLGILTAISADYLVWTSPAGVQGEPVSIANGQQRLLEAGEPGEYVLVSRTSTAPMVGACTVQIVEQLNNIIGMGNSDLSTPGKYRAVGLVAQSPYEIGNVVITLPIDSLGDCDIFVTAEQPTQPNGATFTIVDEETAPAGTYTPDDTVTIPRILPGEWVPLWFYRTIGVSVPDPYVLRRMTMTYNVIG